jgi:bacteriocin biosynthesis cyclodehydratase domain-containing protein
VSVDAREATERPLPERPLLAPWYRCTETADGFALEYADAIVALAGAAARALVPRLAPLLDGTRTVEEVVAELDEPLAEAAVRRLAAEGVILDGDAAAAGETASFCAVATAAPGGPAAAAGRLRTASVELTGAGSAAAELARLLSASGAAVARGFGSCPDASLAVVAPAPHELPSLREWNERLLERGTPWLQVLPHNGRFAAIGPLYVPGDTCCYECFRRRRAAALGAPPELDALERAPARYPDPPAVASAVAGVAAVLALAWLVDPEAVPAGTLYALELGATARLEGHRVYRAPRCPACSPSASLPSPLPWALEDVA